MDDYLVSAHGGTVRLRMRAVYEAARYGMLVRGLRPAEVTVENGGLEGLITYLDGRSLYRAGRHNGDAPPPITIFVHGLGSSIATWSSVLPAVARVAPVVAPDLPGYGRTPLPEGRRFATYRDMVDATHAFVKAISPHRPVHLVGQSMGGWISARVAAEAPERVSRLTLVNCAGVLHPQVFEQRRLFSPENREELRELWRSMWKRLPISYYLLEEEYLRVTRTTMVRGFLDTVEEEDFLNHVLGDIEAPTLLVWGLADRLISYDSVRWFREGIRDLRVREIPGCGHVPQRECTRAYLRYVLPWLRGEEPPGEELPGLHAARTGRP